MSKILLGFHRGVRDLRFGEQNLDELRQLGEVLLNEKTEAYTSPELAQAAKGCRIVVADRLTPGGAAFFDHAPDVVAYIRTVTDMKNVDLEAANRNGILVTTTSATFVPGVSEWVVGQMINLSRSLFDYVNCYRAGWVPDLQTGPRGRQLAGRTAGIIGLGHIGSRVAMLLAAFEMRVMFHDPYVREIPEGLERVDMSTLLKESDFVIPMARHTAETEGMVDEAFLKAMKPSAFLVNASRGGLMDEAALEAALLKGTIAGAALDVGSGDGDAPNLRLARLPNVLATPHVAPSIDANHAQGREAIEKVREVLAGKMPSLALNPAYATRLARMRGDPS